MKEQVVEYESALDAELAREKQAHEQDVQDLKAELAAQEVKYKATKAKYKQVKAKRQAAEAQSLEWRPSMLNCRRLCSLLV
jgi:hypothetical protein